MIVKSKSQQCSDKRQELDIGELKTCQDLHEVHPHDLREE